MKKIFKIIFSFLMSVSFVTPFFNKNVNAAAMQFNQPFDEPMTDKNHGYITVLLENDNGSRYVVTFIWSVQNLAGISHDTSMRLNISEDKIEFIAKGGQNVNSFSFIYQYSSNGSTFYSRQLTSFTETCQTYTYNPSTKIIGYQTKGNINYITNNITTLEPFTIIWGSDVNNKLILNSVLEIEEYLKNQDSIDEEILKELKNLNGDIDTVNTNLTSIIERLRIANNHFIDIKSILNDVWSSIVEINEWISGAMYDVLIDIKNSLSAEEDGIKQDSEILNEQLGNKIDKYDDIESDLVGGLTENLENITPNNDLFTQSDFVKTGVFLSTQMTNIYHSNNIVTALFTFGMILGLAFTIIGISAKR